MIIVRPNANTVHIFAGSEASPGQYLGTAAVAPTESTPSISTLLQRIGGAGSTQFGATLLYMRKRTTLANVNAGATILPGVSGIQYTLSPNVALIAVGGAATANTLCRLTGLAAATLTALFTATQASMTQSAVVTPTVTGGAVIADGASFVAQDDAAAILIDKTGSAMTTATNVDALLAYSETFSGA